MGATNTLLGLFHQHSIEEFARIHVTSWIIWGAHNRLIYEGRSDATILAASALILVEEHNKGGETKGAGRANAESKPSLQVETLFPSLNLQTDRVIVYTCMNMPLSLSRLGQSLPFSRFVRQLEQDMETVVKVLQPGPLGIIEHKFTAEEIHSANSTVKRAVENWRRNAYIEQNRPFMKDFIDK
ncbi:Uncharacterized protein Fot_16718 [Forsythia ovata]|uniref:Uncharacterized protein n=1 Tax=Forsythia ovata TaxID=205694 RepID=A0ABD1VDN5_9LAMI